MWSLSSGSELELPPTSQSSGVSVDDADTHAVALAQQGPDMGPGSAPLTGEQPLFLTSVTMLTHRCKLV